MPSGGYGMLLLLPVAYLVLVLVSIPVRDFGQCTRKCRLDHLGASALDDASVYGRRSWHADQCECFRQDGTPLEAVKRRYNELAPGFPYPTKDKRVCGADGKQYANAASAAAAGTKVINCGPCGSCSTVHDVALYRTFAKPMTVMLSRCALVYLFAGETLARACLQSVFAAAGGFTDKCLNRFIDNYGCTVSHCYKECIFKWDNPLSKGTNDAQGVSHSGKADGTKLSPCMLCDEVYCSPVFVSSGGANRRMSGTVTDVTRPEDEVCRAVNAVQ